MVKLFLSSLLALVALLIIDAFGIEVITDPYGDIDYDEINVYYPNDPCDKD